MTGDEEPDVGSTAVAIASPEDDAIFSPARAAAAKKIVRIRPADTPIMISEIPKITPCAEEIVSMLGRVGFRETTIIVSPTLIRIRTGKITNFAPNKGEANKNEPILKLENKNCATISNKFVRFNPGMAPTPSFKRLII